MNEERTTLEKLVAAGAAVDGLTPSYAVIRNALSDGTAINVHSAVWHVIKPRLISAGVVYWSERLWFDGADNWICVSLATEDVPTLNAILLDYGHASVQPQSTAYQWLALTLFVLLALAAVALAIVVATVGGA